MEQQSQTDQNSIYLPLERLRLLVLKIADLSADRLMGEEEADRRTKAWFSLMGDVTDCDLLPYVIKNVMLRRSSNWRGMVHADEFYRIYHKIMNLRQVWSNEAEEWISFEAAFDSCFNHLVETSNGRVTFTTPHDDVMEEILGMIYGGQ